MFNINRSYFSGTQFAYAERSMLRRRCDSTECMLDIGGECVNGFRDDNEPVFMLHSTCKNGVVYTERCGMNHLSVVLIYVDKDSRNCGIGDELMYKVCEAADRYDVTLYLTARSLEYKRQCNVDDVLRRKYLSFEILEEDKNSTKKLIKWYEEYFFKLTNDNDMTRPPASKR